MGMSGGEEMRRGTGKLLMFKFRVNSEPRFIKCTPDEERGIWEQLRYEFGLERNPNESFFMPTVIQSAETGYR